MPTEKTEAYYNSPDADLFYRIIWGGEDIHIGLYTHPTTPIAEASRQTIHRMLSYLPLLQQRSKVLDLGAGYGGAARQLARLKACRITCLNLSKVENTYNQQRNLESGLDPLIDVVHGNFEELPFADQSFDVVWSEDAFLHSAQKPRIFAEAFRVLRPGGTFIFTDPMQSDDCPPGVLAPILQRLSLTDMASPSTYQALARIHHFRDVQFEDLSPHLTQHYRAVLKKLRHNREELIARGCSKPYLDNMERGLTHWVTGGAAGWLAWGIFVLRKDW